MPLSTTVLFCFYFVVIMKFQRQYERRPQSVTNPEDVEKLLKLREEVMEEFNVNQVILSNEFAR